MKPLGLTLLFILYVAVLNIDAQSTVNFKAIDKHAMKAPKALSTKLPELVEYLSQKSSNDLEKVRSFYSWIIHHIRYDHQAYKMGNKRINHSNQDVLNRGLAVCQGYSSLFKEMCDRSGIPGEIITGYPKTARAGSGDLSTANHTWNAVQINGKWKLLDVTWGAGQEEGFKERYFLSPPESFILDHLPNDPMWQLLDCPIAAEDFRESETQILTRVAALDSCFNFRDSIKAYMALIPVKRKLKTAKTAYQYHPNPENKKMLGSAYMDYNSYLTDLSSRLEQTDSVDAVLALQLEMINTCESASKYIELFDHQKENLAYTHFNYGVALYQQLLQRQHPKKEDKINAYHRILFHFKKAYPLLKGLPSNMLVQHALQQLDEYTEYIELLLEDVQ